MIAASGAIWIDADGNGKRNAALDYANKLLEDTDGDLDAIFRQIDDYDAAVIAQVADLLVQRGTTPRDPAVISHLKSSSPTVRTAYNRYRDQWFESERVRAGNEPD